MPTNIGTATKNSSKEITGYLLLHAQLEHPPSLYEGFTSARTAMIITTRSSQEKLGNYDKEKWMYNSFN